MVILILQIMGGYLVWNDLKVKIQVSLKLFREKLLDFEKIMKGKMEEKTQNARVQKSIQMKAMGIINMINHMRK